MHQVDGFLKISVLRAKYHRATEGDWLLNIVDVDPKSAADVDETCILVELGQDTYCIDNQNIGPPLRIQFRIQDGFREGGFDLGDMAF